MTSVKLIAPGWAASFMEGLASVLRKDRIDATVIDAQTADLTDDQSLLDTDVIVALRAPIDGGLLERCKHLRGVVSPSIGTDGIDLAAATALGIPIINNRVAEHATSMAEATIMMMLAAMYNLNGSQQRFAQENAQAHRPPSARMVQGKTIGIIGFGSIARAVIARLAPWNVKILVASRSADVAEFPGVQLAALDELMEGSDAVLVMTDLRPDTHHLIDAAQLNRMKSSAVLVNTARGPIIDEEALASALGESRIARVALDVFETEPLPADSPLRHFPETILTPHCVGHTVEGMEAIPRQAIKDVRDLIAGDLPSALCNPQVIPSWRGKFGAGTAATSNMSDTHQPTIQAK